MNGPEEGVVGSHDNPNSIGLDDGYRDREVEKVGSIHERKVGKQHLVYGQCPIRGPTTHAWDWNQKLGSLDHSAARDA